MTYRADAQFMPCIGLSRSNLAASPTWFTVMPESPSEQVEEFAAAADGIAAATATAARTQTTYALIYASNWYLGPQPSRSPKHVDGALFVPSRGAPQRRLALSRDDRVVLDEGVVVRDVDA